MFHSLPRASVVIANAVIGRQLGESTSTLFTRQCSQKEDFFSRNSQLEDKSKYLRLM